MGWGWLLQGLVLSLPPLGATSISLPPFPSPAPFSFPLCSPLSPFWFFLFALPFFSYSFACSHFSGVCFSSSSRLFSSLLPSFRLWRYSFGSSFFFFFVFFFHRLTSAFCSCSDFASVVRFSFDSSFLFVWCSFPFFASVCFVGLFFFFYCSFFCLPTVVTCSAPSLASLSAPAPSASFPPALPSPPPPAFFLPGAFFRVSLALPPPSAPLPSSVLAVLSSSRFVPLATAASGAGVPPCDSVRDYFDPFSGAFMMVMTCRRRGKRTLLPWARASPPRFFMRW